MATSTFLSLEQFTFIAVPPESQISSLRVNIYADGRLILNGKFAEALSGKAVEIRFTDDARHLCFFESDSENAVRFPKNGSKRFPSAVEHLKKHKISLPARYEVKFSEDLAFWQGDYSENPPVSKPKSQASLKQKQKRCHMQSGHLYALSYQMRQMRMHFMIQSCAAMKRWMKQDIFQKLRH